MVNYYFTDKLYHHGIKGQKWGFRKQKKKASNNKIKNFLKKQKSEFLQGMHDEQNRIHEQHMRNAQEHNRIHEQNMRNVVQNQQFMNQTVQQAVRASNQAASLSMTGGMNPFMFG